MAQAPQQFSPAQILEAAQRAETEGRTDNAVQFYRHLTDHLPRTLEASAAREAIARLGGRMPGEGGQTGTDGSSASLANGAGTRHGAMGKSAQEAQATNGHANNWARTGAGPQTGAQAHSGRASAQRPNSITVAPASEVRAAGLPLRSRKRYRTGRLVAAIINALGFVELVAGLVLIAGSIPGVLPAAVAPFMALGPLAGGGLVVAGLLQILAGQLARAVYDQASASRDMAAIARMRAARENRQAGGYAGD